MLSYFQGEIDDFPMLYRNGKSSKKINIHARYANICSHIAEEVTALRPWHQEYAVATSLVAPETVYLLYMIGTRKRCLDSQIVDVKGYT